MDEKLEELEARIDGLRTALLIALRGSPNRTEIGYEMRRAERAARQRNAHAGTIEEIVAIRNALLDEP